MRGFSDDFVIVPMLSTVKEEEMIDSECLLADQSLCMNKCNTFYNQKSNKFTEIYRKNSKFIDFYSILCQVIESYIGKSRKIKFCFGFVTYWKIQYVKRINKLCIGGSNI